MKSLSNLIVEAASNSPMKHIQDKIGAVLKELNIEATGMSFNSSSNSLTIKLHVSILTIEKLVGLSQALQSVVKYESLSILGGHDSLGIRVHL